MKKKSNNQLHQKHTFLIGGIIIMSIMLVALLGYFIYPYYNESRIPKEIRTSTSGVRYASIMEENDDYVITAFYPVMADDTLTNFIKTIVSGYVDAYKNNFVSGLSSPIMTIDFQVYQVGDQYESIVLNQAIGSDVDDLDWQLLKTYTFDLEAAQIVKLDGIFKDGYLERIAALFRQAVKTDDDYSSLIDYTIFYQNTLADADNFSAFALDNDHMLIYYDGSRLFTDYDGMITISIDMNYLAYYLYDTLKTTPDNITPLTEDNTYIRYIDPNKPMLALTFDDGPYAPVTVRILDVLAEYDSAATFFVVGSRIHMYADTITTAIERGNEIGNHSYSHKYDLNDLTLDQLREELDGVQEALDEYVGGYQITLLRAPYGDVGDEVKENCGYAIINWSVDPKDWKYHDSESTYQNVLNKVHDGDIVDLHDLYPSTATAMEELIPQLVDMGYQLVTVSELLEYKGYDIQVGKIYYSAHEAPR